MTLASQPIRAAHVGWVKGVGGMQEWIGVVLCVCERERED